MAIKITKKQRKAANGPNAATRKSLSCKSVIEMSDGSVYRGQDARFMNLDRGLGYVKMQSGMPYVKIQNGS